MGEIFHDAVLLYNFPLTLLVGLCLLYWLSVCFGAFDIGSFDADVDVDAHVDVDVSADADVDLDGHAHDQPGSLGGGPFMAVLRFMNVDDIPLMVVLSMQFLFMWMISMISNNTLNPDHSFLFAAALFLPNLIASSLLTRFITLPLKPMMRSLKKDWDEVGSIIGCTGTVKTGEISETFGQVEVMRRGAPTLTHARVSEGAEPLSKGDTALVIDYDSETETCIVKRLDGDQLEI